MHAPTDNVTPSRSVLMRFPFWSRRAVPGQRRSGLRLTCSGETTCILVDQVSYVPVAGMVGIDISASLISKARETEQDEPLGIHYIHADVTAPGALGEGEFDAADPRMEAIMRDEPEAGAGSRPG